MIGTKTTTEELKHRFEGMRHTIGRLSEMSQADFKKSVAAILSSLADSLETVTLQQIAAHETSAQTFQSIGDALKTIKHILEEKLGR